MVETKERNEALIPQRARVSLVPSFHITKSKVHEEHRNNKKQTDNERQERGGRKMRGLNAAD